MRALGYLASALIGAGVATLVTAKVVEDRLLKEYDERFQKELDESIKYLEKYKYGNFVGRNSSPAQPDAPHVAVNVVDNVTAAVSETTEEKPSKNEKVRYDQIIKAQAYLVGEDASDEELEEAMLESEAEIYAITAEEFFENENGWMQGSISYYADGGVLDDHGEVVADWRDLIGDSVPPFGMMSGEPHVVYLRNTKHRREFEVVRDHANAADILAGNG